MTYLRDCIAAGVISSLGRRCTSGTLTERAGTLGLVAANRWQMRAAYSPSSATVVAVSLTLQVHQFSCESTIFVFQFTKFRSSVGLFQRFAQRDDALLELDMATLVKKITKCRVPLQNLPERRRPSSFGGAFMMDFVEQTRLETSERSDDSPSLSGRIASSGLLVLNGGIDRFRCG